jgi:hypothetical protein
VAVLLYTFTHKQYIEQHKNKQYIEQHKNIGSLVRAVPHLCGFILTFASQLRKKHGKTSVRVAEECQLARWRSMNIQWEYIDLTIKTHKLVGKPDRIAQTSLGYGYVPLYCVGKGYSVFDFQNCPTGSPCGSVLSVLCCFDCERRTARWRQFHLLLSNVRKLC